MLTTTLDDIKSSFPCKTGWKKVLKSKPNLDFNTTFPLSDLLASNGPDDVLWVLANVGGTRGKLLMVKLACDCAERLLPVFELAYPDDLTPLHAFDAARGIYGVDETVTFKVNGDYFNTAFAAFAAAAEVRRVFNRIATDAERVTEHVWRISHLKSLLDGSVSC